MSKQNISFFMPINTIKSADSASVQSTRYDKKEVVIVSGWASTPALDVQNQRVRPAGIDASYFINYGWIDYEHDREEIIGEPTLNSFVDSKSGLFVEAALYKENPYVQKIMDLVDTLNKAGSDRKLGFSIEGQAVESDSDPSILNTLFITGVAITKTPANPEATWDVVQKSLLAPAVNKSDAFEAGYDINPTTQQNGAALKPESLLGNLKQLSYSLDNLAPKQLVELATKVARLVDKEKTDSPSLKPLVLQVFSGISRKAAVKELTNWR